MCYAIPGKVISLDAKLVYLDYFGKTRKAANPGRILLSIGEYVYAQGGIIVDTIRKEEAEQILKFWKRRFTELKKKDRDLTKNLWKEKQTNRISRKEIINFLSFEKKEEITNICKMANKLRLKNISNASCVHGIIEFSNYCINDCAYCGIRKSNAKIYRYRMTIEEISSLAEYAVKKLNFRALVLQSGEDFYYSDDDLLSLVRSIRDKCGVLLFMSIGERSFECYKKLFNAGAYGALIRFETSNEFLYSKLRPGKKFSDRINLIKKLKEFGFVVATGFLIGLPDQTIENIANDILLMRSLKPDMVSFGPLIPHPETPLASVKKISPEELLKTIATIRIAIPQSHIAVTTAMETIIENGKRHCLMAGANSIMISLTPSEYKNKYELYPNKFGDNLSTKENIVQSLKLLYELGRAPTDLVS